MRKSFPSAWVFINLYTKITAWPQAPMHICWVLVSCVMTMYIWKGFTSKPHHVNMPSCTIQFFNSVHKFFLFRAYTFVPILLIKLNAWILLDHCFSHLCQLSTIGKLFFCPFLFSCITFCFLVIIIITYKRQFNW